MALNLFTAVDSSTHVHTSPQPHINLMNTVPHCCVFIYFEMEEGGGGRVLDKSLKILLKQGGGCWHDNESHAQYTGLVRRGGRGGGKRGYMYM